MEASKVHRTVRHSSLLCVFNLFHYINKVIRHLLTRSTNTYVMNTTNSSELLDDFPLDILGQQERINRLYTQITLCFPVDEDSPDLQTNIEGIIDTLSQGLVRLSTALPWIAGRVVRELDGFKIRPAYPDSTPRIRTNYLRSSSSFPAWEVLHESSFPFSILDEDKIAPCKTMVSVGEELPVLLTQTNFIKGGLLFTINAQHGSMDMRGQGQVTSMLAKACRGELLTTEAVEVGNMQRTDRIPLLDNAHIDRTTRRKEDPRLDGNGDSAEKPSTSSTIPPTLQPHPVWAYLAFPSSSLSSLKSLAMESVSPGTFVSTDDVLTAFIWKSITRARQPRLQQQGYSSSPTTTLTRNVDVRRHFGLPSTYLGLVTTSTSHTCPVDKLVGSRDLGSIASGLRTALDHDTLVYKTRLQATNISRDNDAAGKNSIAATSNPSLDVRVSSWAKEGFYDLDFGPLLGKPEVVRRPSFVDGAREGLVYFLPKDRDGGIVVGVCLRSEDLERLKGDGEVKVWSQWIG